jgi:hypothetical protein
MKKFLIIVAVVVVVIIIAVVILIATRGKQFMDMAVERGFGTMETMMVANRPESIPEDSIRTVVSSTIEKIKSGELEGPQVQAMMMTFRDCMDDKKIDSLEVITLLEEMERLR